MTIYEDLLKQYNRATGSNCKTIYDPGFKEWLDRYSYALNEYIEFLEDHGNEFKNSNIAELDKGPFDSILVRRTANNIENRLLTEIAQTIKIPKRKVKISKKEIKILHNGELYPIDEYDSFMSYNLFSRNQLDRFSMIHNLGKSILYGVFGNKKDLDMRKKLEDVQSIYKNMNDGEFNIDYSDSNDTYFYIVSSK